MKIDSKLYEPQSVIITDATVGEVYLNGFGAPVLIYQNEAMGYIGAVLLKSGRVYQPAVGERFTRVKAKVVSDEN